MNNMQVTFMLIERLERIPADSTWAHRASGLRGSLIKLAEDLKSEKVVNLRTLEQLHRTGFYILEEAAKAKS